MLTYRIIRLPALVVLHWCLGTLLLSGAQRFERPVPEGGGSTEIRTALGVLNIDEISDAHQNFTVNLYARFRWNDPREAHGGDGPIVKPLADVWHPSILFFNMQKAWSSFEENVQISPGGDVVLRMQFWGDFSQPLKLDDFPFDQQSIEIRLVRGSGGQPGEVSFVDDPEFEPLVADAYSVPDWKVIGFQTSNDPLVLPGDAKIESYALEVTVKRLPNHYILKVIAPLLLIVLLSWVVFWLDPSEGGSQLGVAVTCFLTVIAYHIALGSRLPEIPYLTRLDVFVFGATLLVFLAMIEVVVATGMARAERISSARWMDRVCRLVFPGSLVLIGFYAFVWR